MDSLTQMVTIPLWIIIVVAVASIFASMTAFVLVTIAYYRWILRGGGRAKQPKPQKQPKPKKLKVSPEEAARLEEEIIRLNNMIRSDAGEPVSETPVEHPVEKPAPPAKARPEPQTRTIRESPTGGFVTINRGKRQ